MLAVSDMIPNLRPSSSRFLISPSHPHTASLSSSGSCRSGFCLDRPWSWECRHCRRFDSSSKSSKLDIEDMELMEDSGDYSPSSGDYSPSYSDGSGDSDYSSDVTENSYDSEDDEEEEFVYKGSSDKKGSKFLLIVFMYDVP